jgi:hypothetical protein
MTAEGMLSEERLAAIRKEIARRVDNYGESALRWPEKAVIDLLAHVDALGRERAPKAPAVTDAMVERAARAMYEGAGWSSRWGDLPVQELYRISARRALTAALGGDRGAGGDEGTTHEEPMSEPNLTEYLREMRAEGERLRANATTDTPRRIDMNRWSPAEAAIQHAADMVEGMGAHPHLTDAVVLLAEARGAVAAFVDGDAERYPRATPDQVTEERVDTAAWQMARITHPTFHDAEAWKWAEKTFKAHWRKLARIALTP